MKKHSSRIEADVIVIGSGIAGAMAAYAQFKRGKNVVVIDRGGRLSKETIQDVFDSESFIGNSHVQQLRIDFAGDKSRARPMPAMVGGLARVYSGVSLRMREREFTRWPFSYDDLEPYYSEAESLMHVSGNRDSNDVTAPRRSGVHPLTLPSMSDHAMRLYRAATRCGLHPFQHPFVIDFEPKCVMCNHCNQVPCLYNCKWNPDTFLSQYEGNKLKMISRLEAVSIEWSGNGEERSVVGIKAVDMNSGEEVGLYAKKYILAAGAILSPRLLLESGVSEWNPLVGTHLMTHCLGLVVGFFPFRMSAEGDFHKWFSVSDYYFDDQGDVRGLIQQDHLTARKKIFGSIPKILHPFISLGYYNSCQMLVMAEDEPIASNRIVLDDTRESRVLVHHDFTKGDRAKRAFLAAKTKKILPKAGALVAVSFNGKSIYHACGTCRMGNDVRDSVTDSCGRLHGVDNLYVADASLFPTSSGVNPSLTIAASALRVADNIDR